MRMNLDFPLLKTFKVDSKTLDFLNRKSQQYFKDCPTIPAENDFYISDTGQFTYNLAYWKDKEYQQFVDEELVNTISDFTNSHNIHIDSDGYLYVVGASDYDLWIYELTDHPGNPILVGTWNPGLLNL